MRTFKIYSPVHAYLHAKSLQLCPTLCDPVDYSPPVDPLSIGFFRQEYCSGLPCLPPGHFPYPGIKPTSPALAGRFFTTSISWEAPFTLSNFQIHNGVLLTSVTTLLHPMTYLYHNWKLVLFDPLHPYHLPPKSRHPTSGNHQTWDTFPQT